MRKGQDTGTMYRCLVTTALAEGMEVRIGLSQEGHAMRVYTMGHWDGQPEIQWKFPTCSFGSGTSHSGFSRFNPVELGRGAVEPLNRG